MFIFLFHVVILLLKINKQLLMLSYMCVCQQNINNCVTQNDAFSRNSSHFMVFMIPYKGI